MQLVVLAAGPLTLSQILPPVALATRSRAAAAAAGLYTAPILSDSPKSPLPLPPQPPPRECLGGVDIRREGFRFGLTDLAFVYLLAARVRNIQTGLRRLDTVILILSKITNRAVIFILLFFENIFRPF